MDQEIENTLNPVPYKYKVSNLVKIIFVLFFMIGIFLYFYMIIDRRISQRRFMLENQMAAVRLAPMAVPSFIMSDPVTNNKINLSDFQGQWILLNMWATWCPPCQEEMPSLELLHNKLGDRVKIIALSVDDNAQAIKDFIKIHKPSFIIMHDFEHKSANVFGVSKYPETFLISPAGILIAQLSGPRDWASDSMLTWVLSMLKEL